MRPVGGEVKWSGHDSSTRLRCEGKEKDWIDKKGRKKGRKVGSGCGSEI